jgi:prepilin-type processing-associated H-X9-DG protein
MTPALSVVMPVHNEASHVRATVRALVTATERSGITAELIVVDDGSTDESATVAREAAGTALPVSVVPQSNAGRFAARRAGVETARGDAVLLLDGRVRLAPNALAFAIPRVARGQRVWTSHINVAAHGNLYGLYWQLLAELAWFDYFRNPRELSFGSDDFDRYPKGTTAFLAPRELLLEAFAAFQTRYSDSRYANDDTPFIRWIAAREPISISPRFASDYSPRTSFGAFVRHSFRRGIVFLDGHGRPESRLFPIVVAFYPVSVLLALAATRWPRIAVGAVAATSLGASGLGVMRRRSGRQLASLALLTPVYAAAHGAGMWRGLVMLGARGVHVPNARNAPPR